MSSAEKKSLLAKVLREKISKSQHYPLSFAQKRFWFLDQIEEHQSTYNLPMNFRLIGTIDLEVLKQTFETIIERHQILRTTFQKSKGSPVQVISKKRTIELQVIDIESFDISLIRKEEQTPFDIANGPLFRVKLLRLNEKDHVLMINMHHIVSDGPTLDIVISEFIQIYRAIFQGKPHNLSKPKAQHTDFALWQNQQLENGVFEDQLKFWKQQLAGTTPLLNLPTDYPRPQIQNHFSSSKIFSFQKELCEQLLKLGRKEQATLYMTLLSAFNVILFRYSGQKDLSIGTPVSNRNHEEFENIAGPLINTVVMRTLLSEKMSFRDLLKKVKITALNVYSNMDIPFEYVVENTQKQRSLSHAPLFQVMFALQNWQESVNNLVASGLPGVTIETIQKERPVSQYDLTLQMVESSGMLLGSVEYKTSLFKDSRIERLIEHFHNLLWQIVKNPDEAIGNFQFLTSKEKGRVESIINKKMDLANAPQPVIKQFEAQVAKSPESIALCFGDDTLNYRMLNEWSNRFAHYLIRKGLPENKLIGICLEPGFDMIISTLGILKAGCAYFPLDANYPLHRKEVILKSFDNPLLVTNRRNRNRLDGLEFRALEIDELKKDNELSSMPYENTQIPISGDDLIYVIFTSGSTGTPKGAGVYQKGFANLLKWFCVSFASGPKDSFLLISSFSFDLTQKNIFAPLLTGGRLCLIGQSQYDPSAIASEIEKHRITSINCTPSAFYPLIQSRKNLSELSSLKNVHLGGERINSSILKGLLDSEFSASIYNQYGPAECADISVFHKISNEEIDSQHSIPIGREIEGAKVYILDNMSNPVPTGILGEICIGGAGVGAGYVNSPEQTARLFFEKRWENGTVDRLYRTGDLAFFRDDGLIEFVGRKDHQIKLRGMRIELGEVEHRLRNLPMVKDGVVKIQGKETHARLVAYVVLNEGESNCIRSLKSALSKKLPDHMVPTFYKVMDSLPFNANGKVDRLALPLVDYEPEFDYILPHSETEKKLDEIWRNVLKIGKIGIKDSLFEVGGHSLNIVKIADKIQQVFSIEVSLNVLFEQNTIEKLAIYIDDLKQNVTRQINTTTAIPVLKSRTEPHLLSFAQERLWFMEQLSPGNHDYNMISALHLRGELNLKALKNSFNIIVERHEILRTSFPSIDGSPMQQVSDSLKIHFKISDLRSELPINEDERASNINKMIREEASHPFHLFKNPLWRVNLYRIRANEYILVLVIHHIIADGASIGIILHELSLSYGEYLRDKTLSLPKPSIQYLDYSSWQREQLSEDIYQKLLGYWTKQLNNLPPPTTFPCNRTRPSHIKTEGACVEFILPNYLLNDLNILTQQTGATNFMALLTAFKILLSIYSGQEDILVGSPVSNRENNALNGLVGLFLNTLVLRTFISRESTFMELLNRVKTSVLGALEHSTLPYERIVKELAPRRGISQNPFFHVIFNYQNHSDVKLNMLDLSVKAWKHESWSSVRTDLDLYATETESTIDLTFIYNVELFDYDTIERAGKRYVEMINKFVKNPYIKVQDLIFEDSRNINALPSIIKFKHQ